MSDLQAYSIQHGIEAYQKGEFGKAIEILTDALRQSQEAAAYLYRGISYRMRGEHEKALIDLSLAIELNGHFFPEAFRQRGLVYQAIGEMERARYDLAVSLSDRGMELVKQGDLSRAMSFYNNAINTLPTFAQAYNNRANIHLKEGNLDAAIADFSEAIRLKPDSEEAYSNRAAVLIKKKLYDQALQDCMTATRIRPLYAPAYNNRALVYKALEQYDKALRDCDTAIMLKPDYAEAYGNRGMIHLLRLNPEKALIDLEIAVEMGLDPREVYEVMVGLQSLKEGLQALAAPDTQPLESPLEKGLELLRSNHLNEAEDAFRKAIQLTPQEAAAYSHLGNLYRLRGEYDQAIAQYSIAIDRDPKQVDAYLGRGLVYLEQEPQDYAAAIADFNRVLEYDGVRNVVYRLRGVAYLQMNKIPDALRDLQKYLSTGGAADNNEVEQITSMVAELRKVAGTGSLMAGK